MRKSIYSKQQEVLLRLLVQARRAADATQGDLAVWLGITQSEVSKHERGERGLDFLQVRSWVEALGVPFEVFVADFEEKLAHSSVLTTARSRAARDPTRPGKRSKAGGT